MKRAIGVTVLVLALSACGPRGLYDWGGYSQALNAYYGDPEKLAAYRATLVAIVDAQPAKRVPPGIYAELGYLDLAAGDTEEAKRLFQLEKAAWPESAEFMNRMIRKIDDAESEPTTGEPVASLTPTS